MLAIAEKSRGVSNEPQPRTRNGLSQCRPASDDGELKVCSLPPPCRDWRNSSVLKLSAFTRKHCIPIRLIKTNDPDDTRLANEIGTHQALRSTTAVFRLTFRTAALHNTGCGNARRSVLDNASMFVQLKFIKGSLVKITVSCRIHVHSIPERPPAATLTTDRPDHRATNTAETRGQHTKLIKPSCPGNLWRRSEIDQKTTAQFATAIQLRRPNSFLVMGDRSTHPTSASPSRQHHTKTPRES